MAHELISTTSDALPDDLKLDVKVDLSYSINNVDRLAEMI